MLVAVSSRKSPNEGLPFIAVVKELPGSVTDECEIMVEWMKREAAPHKSKWLRYLENSGRTDFIPITDIILYDFELTKNGGLKKTTRDFLKEHY